ncbi:MAG: long-chain-fatty-acid--CoA ligase [Methanobacteriota archaeon]|nr:MAG: long-chain-fatty-acid--CoA ligase [Euryarchaeota archaeon]
MSLSNILKTAVENFQKEDAIICGPNRLTYSEFLERVLKSATALKDLGVGVRDRVAIIHRNCHHFLESYFATAWIGAVLVPVNYRLSSEDFSYIFENSGAKCIITEPDLVERVQSAVGDDTEDICLYKELLGRKDTEDISPQDVQDTEMAQIYYTSGTTGRPKGVILTHRNNYVHAVNTVEEIQLTKNDRWLHVSPMYHLADAWSAWAITLVGGKHVFVSEFDTKRVLETIERDKVTLCNFIPTMLNMLVNHPEVDNYDCSSLRFIMSGGAPIAPEIIRKIIDKFGCEYIQTYGMTETSPFLTMSILKNHLRDLPFEERLRYLATTGRPFKGVELRVVKEDGAEVEPNDEDVGEIIVKGETITPGYWQLPDETKERIRDGWLHTRDLAILNEEGYVTIVDRMDDMIITGGENVYSIEVENVLYENPKILEAGVIGIDDQVWGERIVAVVVPKENEQLTEVEVMDHCKGRLAAFKAPKQVILVSELPKTESGKIKKRILRERYRTGP